MNASILTGSVEGVLSRNEMKLILAGSLGESCGQCCYDHNPTNCSACVDHCSGSDCDCRPGIHGPTHGAACTCSGVGEA